MIIRQGNDYEAQKGSLTVSSPHRLSPRATPVTGSALGFTGVPRLDRKQPENSRLVKPHCVHLSTRKAQRFLLMEGTRDKWRD